MTFGNVTIGNFKDIWWVSGGKAYLFLPYEWSRCCYMATLKLPYEVLGSHKATSEVGHHDDIVGSRFTRKLAQFNNLESYHWRVTLGENGVQEIFLAWLNVFG